MSSALESDVAPETAVLRRRPPKILLEHPPKRTTFYIWFADVMASFSGVTFVLFCFASFSVFILSLKPRPFVQSSFFDMQAPQ